MFKPSSNILTDRSKEVFLLLVLFCYLLFVFRVCLCHTVMSFSLKPLGHLLGKG